MTIMKRVILMACLLVGMASASAQSYKVSGNVYSKATTERVTAKNDSTMYKYEVKGIKYTIHLSKNGRAYIIRTSKKGNTYKQYLGEEVSRDICKRMGRTYVEKK